jgi:hypothetical protein
MRLADLIAVPTLLAAFVSGCRNGARATADSGAHAASSGAPSADSAPSPSTQQASASPPRSKEDAAKPAESAEVVPETGDNPVDFGSRIKIAGLTDPKTCAVDGPFWPEAVSFYGGDCSKEEPYGCFEAAQAFYQWGRWACAREYHKKACALAPHLTAPPPGGGDYALAGYPQCPFDKEGRAAWKDKELKDPTKKRCFVEHVGKACEQLAEKSDDVWAQQKLRDVAATLRER